MGRKGENIYKRKDGRWEARFVKGYSVEGKIFYGYCYGKTYQEAKQKVNQARASFFTQQPIPEKRRNRRLSSYCDEWLQLKRSRVKASTPDKYESVIQKHIKPKLGGHYAEMLTEIQVEQFSYGLLHEENLSPKTIKDILAILRSILNYVNRQSNIMKPIEIVYPKNDYKEMRVLSEEEQRRFVQYLLTDMDECKFGVLLALLTGLRLGEICALRWSDISIRNQTICVRHTMQRLKNNDTIAGGKTKIVITAPKSNTSFRVIPLNNDTAELCKQWRPQNNAAYILTGKENCFIEPRTLQYRMARYTKGCGLEGVHFHTLRHSFATRCIEVGFDIKSLSEILGHASPTITLERYVHSSMQLKRENMNKLNGQYEDQSEKNTKQETILAPSKNAVKIRQFV